MYRVIYLFIYSFIKICYFSHLSLKLFLEIPICYNMTVCFRYLPLEEGRSLELESKYIAPKKCLVVNTEIVTCGGRGQTGSNFGIISGQSKLFRHNLG